MNYMQIIKRFYRGIKSFSEQVRRKQIFQVCRFFSLGEESWLEEEAQDEESGGVKRMLACRHNQSLGTRETDEKGENRPLLKSLRSSCC